jgi:hypothetical protein
MDPRDVEIMTNNVTDKALDNIIKRLRWPLVLAAASAAYAGYNLWSDVKNRIDTFQKLVDDKLVLLEKSANERLDKELKKVLEDLNAQLSARRSFERRPRPRLRRPSGRAEASESSKNGPEA